MRCFILKKQNVLYINNFTVNMCVIFDLLISVYFDAHIFTGVID